MLYVDIGVVLQEPWAVCLAEDRADEIARLADVVASMAHPEQRGFVVDPSLRPCAVVGRGGGKTTGGEFRFVRRMLTTARAACLYIATTREQAEKLMWAPLKNLCGRLNIDARFYEDRLRCVFLHNGATLSLAGADDKKQIEKFRGIPHHEVGIDECASFPPRLLDNLIDQVIVPRLGDYNGTLWLIGTPGKALRGSFYEVTRPGSNLSRPYRERAQPEWAGWDSWSLHTWSLQDAAAAGVKAAKNLWAAALREKKNKGWSDDHPVWKREYLGQWAADDTETVYRYRPHDGGGEPFNQWDPERLPSGLAKLPGTASDWCFVYGMDIGHSDPTAIEVFAYSPTDPSKTLYHVYEFEQRGMYARTIAAHLIGERLDAESPAGIIGETGWPEGMIADIAGAGQSLLDELANVYGLRMEAMPRKFGDKLDGIELFNGDLMDGRIKILKGSKLEEQLGDLQWVVGEHGELKEDKGARNDCADAAVGARRIAKHLLSEEGAPPEPYFKPPIEPPGVPVELETRQRDEFSADLFPDYSNYDAFDDAL